MARLVPTYHALNVYEVASDFYAKQGIKNIFLDLDNTLDSYQRLKPTIEAVELVKKLQAHGYHVFIISNNREKRVAAYAKGLGVDYLASAGKPFPKKFIAVMKKFDMKKDETILIGDQLLTDVKVANKIGIKVLLTEKLVKEDQWTTRFNRLLDRPLRRRLKKKKLLPSWREYYE